MTTPTDREGEPAKAGLFEDLPEPSPAQWQQAQAKAASKRGRGSPRLLQPNRAQIELRASDLESLLPEAHRARLVWGYVVHQDLSKLFEAVKARGSNAGRAAIDPRILFALWLYATLDGVGSGHAFDFAKYAHRYLAEAQYRFNRRFNLRSILPRLLRAACLTSPQPAAAIRAAEVGR